MMKYFIGVCCAMLLGLSACVDIDSPEFPPSEVKSEVKEVVDFSYTELENLESTHSMHLNYRNRVYVFSADIVLDSPYQSFGHIEYFISPDKDNLTDKALLSYSFDYDNVYSVYPEYYYGWQSTTAIWYFDHSDWQAGTYYYRAVAYSNSWGSGPGILHDCLQQDSRQATLDDLKSFTIPTKYLPYADLGYANENEVSVYFGVDGFEGRFKEVGVCYSDVNQLPTIADKTYVSESADGMHFIGPLLQKAYYMRPFVVTKDNDTIYGYVQRIQYSR